MFFWKKDVKKKKVQTKKIELRKMSLGLYSFAFLFLLEVPV